MRIYAIYKISKYKIISILFVHPSVRFFIIVIMLFYFYKNQMILPSYASSMILLYATLSWLTIINFNLDSIQEKHMLFIQLDSKLKYLNYKMLFSFLSSIPLVMFSILYPIITNSFSESFDLYTIILSIYLHLIIVMIDVLVASFITVQKFFSQKYSWLLLVLIYVISIIKFAIVQSYPVLKFLLFFIPPVGNFLNLFNKSTSDIWSKEFILLNLEIVLFICIAIVLINYIYKKSEYY